MNLTTLLIIVGVVVLLLLIVGIVMSTRQEKTEVDERLEQIVEEQKPEVPAG